MSDEDRYDYDRQRYWRDRSETDEWRDEVDNNRDDDWSRAREWDRARQWRRESGSQERDQELRGRHQPRQENPYQDPNRYRGRGYEQDRQRYQRNYNTDWDADTSDDRSWDYGYNRSDTQDYRRAYEQNRSRGWDRDRDRERWDQNRAPDQNTWGYSPEDNPAQNWERDPGYGREWSRRQGQYRRQGYNRDRGYGYKQGRGQGNNRDSYYGLGQDVNRDRDRGWNQPAAYPSAGMGADYGDRSDYQGGRSRREDVNYAEGDVGYDREGAFYQDMDEPENFEMWEEWEIAGKFSGMGPLGYQRSDQRISDDVCDRLTEHGRIDARDIEVDVKDGIVTLKGSVPDRNMKRMAEEVTEDISGVKEVQNQIKVQQRQRDWERTNQDRDQNYYDRMRDHGQSWESRWPEQTVERTTEEMNRNPRKEDYENINREGASSQSTAGETKRGEGLTGGGATSLSGIEAATNADQNRQNLREGMEVIGSDGKVVGRVKEIRARDFLIDRDMARDIYAPIEMIRSTGAQVMLAVPAGEVDNQNWEKPNLV